MHQPLTAIMISLHFSPQILDSSLVKKIWTEHEKTPVGPKNLLPHPISSSSGRPVWLSFLTKDWTPVSLDWVKQ